MLLTYNLRIRNTDPRFHLVSMLQETCFWSQMKNAVFVQDEFGQTFLPATKNKMIRMGLIISFTDILPDSL